MEIYVRVLVRCNIARRQERDINYAPERVHIFPYLTNNIFIRRRKKSCLFPLTQTTLVFHADPKVFFSSITKKILIKPNFFNLLQFCWQFIKIMVFNLLFNQLK